MNWAKMKKPMIKIYLKHYSEKEIKDMVAFYKSDSGQSMIQKMPAVMGDSMLLSQEMMCCKGYFTGNRMLFSIKALFPSFRKCQKSWKKS